MQICHLYRETSLARCVVTPYRQMPPKRPVVFGLIAVPPYFPPQGSFTHNGWYHDETSSIAMPCARSKQIQGRDVKVVYTEQLVEVREGRPEYRGTARPAAHHNINAHKHTRTDTAMEGMERLGALYHRPADICIMPGEMLDGGLAMRLPVAGFTIAMALVPERIAEGW